MPPLQFWKPGTSGPGSTLDRIADADKDVIASAPGSAAYGIQGQRQRLPIFKHRMCLIRLFGQGTITHLGDNILHCVERYQVVIVVGQTGSGKTTRAVAIDPFNATSHPHILL